VRIAEDGDTIEIDAGDYLADVAVLSQARLTLRGIGGRARLIADGASAEDKAILVVRGGEIVIENIEFSGARATDKNGAGIRFEKGDLTLRNCRFFDNENGLLAAQGGRHLDIEDSEFAHNGAGDGRSHNLYVSAIRRLRVSGSYFHHARSGHLLKSRAQESFILYSRLTDEAGGQASYELEFPNGGKAVLIGNIIQQGAQTENRIMISFGAEGYLWAENALYLSSNTLVDGRAGGGIPLRVAAGAQAVRAFNNLLSGPAPLGVAARLAAPVAGKSGPGAPVTPPRGSLQARPRDPLAALLAEIPGDFQNNRLTAGEAFVQSAPYDYRLKASALKAASFVDPGVVDGLSLVPGRQYRHPAGSVELPAAPTVPGALQPLGD
jgi:hypothetical protein